MRACVFLLPLGAGYLAGRIVSGHPVMGSWICYGLGSESQELPAFVALPDPVSLPVSGVEHWANGWLPSIYQGTVVRSREPRIANLDDWWCQGFSEPDAGSDLASLKTTARRVGDRFIVNGQKTWTTYAQYADWIFCLVRTDPAAKKQAGISFLLVDMRSPGVTVRPIITVDGRAVNGNVIEETAEEYVVATDADHQVRLNRQDVEEIHPSKVSTMPSGLDQQLTTQQLADLVAFLKSARD